MNNDKGLIAEAYSRIYLKEDADFADNTEATLEKVITGVTEEHKCKQALNPVTV